MIILDTNVASEPTKMLRDPRVHAWVNRQLPDALFFTAISVAEMLSGVAVLPDGRRKTALAGTLEQIIRAFGTRVLPFDQDAALAYAEVVVRSKASHYTLSIPDAQIAAIAKVHGFAVATRDVDPFTAAGVAVINPWDE